jgi:hypothetical protein
MKKLLMSSLVLVLFALSIILFQLSCKKDAVAQTGTLTKQQILVQKTWKLDQLHSVINGVYASYFNGGTNTTGENYGNLRYTFKDDGTGTYIDQTSASRSFTWQFTSGDQRSMRLVISGAAAADNWQMVEIAGNYMHCTENFAIGSNSNNLHAFRLIQIP